MSGAVPPFLHMPPWHAMDQLCLYHNMYFQALREIHTAHCEFFFEGNRMCQIMGGLCGVCTFFEFNMRMANDNFFNKFNVCQ